MKKILVPTDFSEYANNALYLASQLAKTWEGSVVLLNVIEPIKSYVAATDGMYIDASVEQKYIDYLSENAKTQLEETVKKAEADGVKIETAVALGSIFNAIEEQVKENNIDLIVMGTQGVSGIDEILIGSNTEKIVRTAICPVLTVKNRIEGADFKSIVFATNFKAEHVLALQEVKAIQKAFDAKLHILYVNVPNDFYTNREIYEKRDAFIKEADVENYEFSIYNEVNEENGIIYYAEDLHADLIAVVTHQRTGLAHLISGSIAEDVVNHANRPVLTFGIKRFRQQLKAAK